jgi:hypothetical protein
MLFKRSQQGLGGFARPRRPRPPHHRECGAVMVEFAFALMFIFLVFIAYIQVSEIFLAHERLRYASSVASRAYAVGGSASGAASKIDQNYDLKTKKENGAQTVTLTKKIDLPEAVGKLFGEKDGFTIAHALKTYMEPSQFGDNKAQ